MLGEITKRNSFLRRDKFPSFLRIKSFWMPLSFFLALPISRRRRSLFSSRNKLSMSSLFKKLAILIKLLEALLKFFLEFWRYLSASREPFRSKSWRYGLSFKRETATALKLPLRFNPPGGTKLSGKLSLRSEFFYLYKLLEHFFCLIRLHEARIHRECRAFIKARRI